MGNYREQYERYYGNLKNRTSKGTYKRIGNNEDINKSKSTSSKNNYNRSTSVKNSINNRYNRLGKVNGNKELFLERYSKRFIYQLIGALLLLVLILVIRMIPLEQAQEAYTVSKDAIEEDFNLSEAVMSIDIPGVEEYKESALDYIDKVKSAFTGEKTLKEKIKDEFMMPVLGKIQELSSNNKGVAIVTAGNIEVVSCYEGKVVEVKQNEDGYHVLINNGYGVETYYGLLSSINVKEGDEVLKGQAVGTVGTIDNNKTAGMVFKIIYMGSEKNPSDLMDLSSLKEV